MAAGARWRRAQRWKVRPANCGIAASRWMPTSFSAAIRSGRLRSVQFASGATGVPSRPASVGRAMTLSRRATPSRSFRRAFARVLISAIWTPCGQTCVQIPQLEQ